MFYLWFLKTQRRSTLDSYWTHKQVYSDDLCVAYLEWVTQCQFRRHGQQVHPVQKYMNHILQYQNAWMLRIYFSRIHWKIHFCRVSRMSSSYLKLTEEEDLILRFSSATRVSQLHSQYGNIQNQSCHNRHAGRLRWSHQLTRCLFVPRNANKTNKNHEIKKLLSVLTQNRSNRESNQHSISKKIIFQNKK